MSKYSGFKPKSITLLRQGMFFREGYPEEELRTFLELASQDYIAMNQEEVMYYNDSIRMFQGIMKSHPEIVHNVAIALTKSHGTDRFIEFVIQLTPDGEFYITEEIEYLIKIKMGSLNV